MALAPLATAADLSAYGFDVSTAATDTITSNLEAASSAVREAAGSSITVSTATITIPGTPSPWLAVPLRPLRSVTAVTLDGVATDDYYLRNGRLWRRFGWQALDFPSDVTITAAYGLDAAPAHIVRLVCSLAVGGILEAQDGAGSHTGLQYESVDDYRVGYAQGADATVSVTEIPERTRKALQAQFGGGVYVTGSY